MHVNRMLTIHAYTVFDGATIFYLQDYHPNNSKTQ